MRGSREGYPRAIVERALQAELTTHRGYEKHAAEGRLSGNSRNGVSSKQLKGNFGEVDIEVPRDRQGSFEPKLVAKGRQTRFAVFDTTSTAGNAINAILAAAAMNLQKIPRAFSRILLALQPSNYDTESPDSGNQLILFDF